MMSGSQPLTRTAIASVLLVTFTLTGVYTSFAGHKKSPGSNTSNSSLFNSGKRYEPLKRHPSTKAISWAESQLRRMSLDEQIGQLISIGINGRYLNQDSDAYRSLVRQVEKDHVGGIVLYRGSVYESVHLVNRMQKLARYPLLVSADMEIGAGMRFEDTVSIPSNMAIGATGNPKYARRQGDMIAREARALGIRQIFGPVIDVNNNPDNPIINIRAYSEDPARVAEFGAAFIKGAQGNGVIATAKHFPGHGNTDMDSHRALPVINLDRAKLNSVELVPYRAAIRAGVGSVMPSFIALPNIDSTVIKPLPPEQRTTGPSELVQGGEIAAENATLPAALSPVLIKDLLRRDLRFEGLVVTDALDMSGLTIYFNQDKAGVLAIAAGADMLIKPSNVDEMIGGLREAAQNDAQIRRRIRQSALRILALKFDLGLVRQRLTVLGQIDRLLSNSEVVIFAEEVANHAITLVRNKANLLPLNLRPNAKIFNLAITNGDDRLSVTMPFVQEMSREGSPIDTVVLDGRSSPEEINEAMKRAQESDLVIASLYGRVRAGEANSAGLPAPPANALAELVNSGKPVIGISFGNPYLLKRFPQLQTYITAYGDVPSLQEAAARALLGQIDIIGKLPIGIPPLHPAGTGIEIKARNKLNKGR
jgi:beta-N-acetylhexosaminidase